MRSVHIKTKLFAQGPIAQVNHLKQRIFEELLSKYILWK